ncbi:MAG: potassium-transporting ATPase subunit KdpC [Acetobacteraceae bacterium]
MQQLRPAIVLIALFTLLTGVAFPLVFVGIGNVVFPFQAGGSLIRENGQVVGSTLIGQDFSAPRYFHPRPSATTEPDPKDASKTVPVPYAADNSAASNLGPTSKALIDRVTADVKAFGTGSVPADAVTTSASGLDPDISPENAALQVARVAKARNLPEATIRDLVAANTKGRIAGFIGEPRVNVLALNRAIDAHG